MGWNRKLSSSPGKTSITLIPERCQKKLTKIASKKKTTSQPHLEILYKNHAWNSKRISIILRDNKDTNWHLLHSMCHILLFLCIISHNSHTTLTKVFLSFWFFRRKHPSIIEAKFLVKCSQQIVLAELGLERRQADSRTCAHNLYTMLKLSCHN